MRRQPVNNGTWFDLNAAQEFDEKTHWNGQNHISDATGSQWEHETLYRTKSKCWVLYSHSDWQGSEDEWEQIDDSDAATWLVANGHEHPDVAEAIAELEI
jgi:hypothetical protein